MRRPRLDHPPWWRVAVRRRLDETKRQLLEVAWRVQCPLYFLPADVPPEPDLQPFVQREDDAWRLKTARSASDFYGAASVSGMGGWRLYAAPTSLVAHPPDTFRDTPAAVTAFMVTHDSHSWPSAASSRLR